MTPPARVTALHVPDQNRLALTSSPQTPSGLAGSPLKQ